MDVLTFILTCFACFIVYFVVDTLTKDRVRKLVDRIPGPPRIPILGTTYIILFTKKEQLFNTARKRIFLYGPILRTWLGSTPVVHMLTPENAEIVLNNSVQINKENMYDFIRPWLCDGLLTSTGAKWHHHRKLITPTFHFKILESFMEVFVERSEALVEKIKTLNRQNEPFDLYPYITRCTLDIICETAMGVQINALDEKESEYVNSIYAISRNIIQRIIKPWLHPDFVFFNTQLGRDFKRYIKVLHDFTTKVIKERREVVMGRQKSVDGEKDEFGTKKRKALLDLFLEMSIEGNAFNDLEIREQVDTFMFEGHDTTTAAICWSLFLLGNHPKIQDKVYNEIMEVFSASPTLTVNDMSKLKLLERCIKEALRIYPSVPVIGRRLTEDIKIGKYTVPSGCAIHIQIFAIHRNKDIYPEPEKFDPDRFLPENVKNRHPYAYVPFSAGPRNCIGQKFAMYEEKTLLAYILKNFKVTALENQKTVTPMIELILRPKNGLLVKLEPRN